MIYKILGILIIGVAGLLAFFTFSGEGAIFLKNQAPCLQLTPGQQFAKMINEDFRELARSQQLPADWNSIATVEVRMNSQLANALLGKERPSIQRIKEGANYLELEFMDIPDEENPGVIIQASLFNIKSKNKIFEIGRTYSMTQLNKVPTAIKQIKKNKGL